jgi:hypothetical protein
MYGVPCILYMLTHYAPAVHATKYRNFAAFLSNSKSTSLQLTTLQIAQFDSSLTVGPARLRPLVLSTMGVPFEALLPYGIMIGVRWLSVGLSCR